MGLNRSSLRSRLGELGLAVGCALMVSVLAACGAPGAAAPTPTPATATAPATVPAPSPQRPPLASPIASPSSVATGATPSPATPEAAGETYEVQSGDTLLSIAETSYGDATLWRRIYDANKDTIGPDPDKLKLGMKLTIPPKQ